jgi:hypothetical protein
VVEMTLEINLYELTVPLEYCILESEGMEMGKFFKILKRKMYSMGKKIVSSSNLLLLRWEVSLCGGVLKGQHVVLIKWENFSAFLS